MDLLNQLSIARANGLFQQKSIAANCLSSDLVGNCVYITGPAVAGIYQVATAEPRDGPNKMPAVGIILSKSSPTNCKVHVLGELKGVVSALTPGKVVFVDVDGTLTHVPPTALPSQLVYIQTMGVALSSDVVLVLPDFTIIKRRG